MIAVATMMLTIEVTTAAVVASPTAEALRPHCIPLMHPARATIPIHSRLLAVVLIEFILPAASGPQENCANTMKNIFT